MVPECHERVGLHEGSGEVSEGDGDEGGDEIRATLLKIAEYERECGSCMGRFIWWGILPVGCGGVYDFFSLRVCEDVF